MNYDDVVLLADANLRGLDPQRLRAMFSSTFVCNYTPLSLVTYGLDFTLWGMRPAGYHLTSLTVHCVNAVLAALVALELFSCGEFRVRDFWAAGAAALLFAVHPLRVEAVAWVAERREVLAGFFLLLTALFWLKACHLAEPHARFWRTLALAGFVLSLLCKLSGVMLPAALVLLDVYPLRRLPPSPRVWATARLRPLWREKFWFVAVAVPFIWAGITNQANCGAVVSMRTISGVGRALLAGTGLLFYIGKTLWPTELSVIYRWSLGSLQTPVLVGAAGLAAGGAAAYFSRRSRPALLTAFGFYALMLVPVLGVFKIGNQVASDRYTYLPCLAWAFLGGAALREASKKIAAARACAAAILLLFVALTWSQCKDWSDSETLWRHALKLEPLSSIAHQDLAEALLAQGRDGEAILYLEEEVRLYPGDTDSQKTLAAALARTHITLRDHAGIHNALGIERAERGQLPQALWHFRKALTYDPDSKNVKENIARAARGETTGYAR